MPWTNRPKNFTSKNRQNLAKILTFFRMHCEIKKQLFQKSKLPENKSKFWKISYFLTKSYLEVLSLVFVDPFGRGDPALESLITWRWIADSDDISVWIAAMVSITFYTFILYFTSNCVKMPLFEYPSYAEIESDPFIWICHFPFSIISMAQHTILTLACPFVRHNNFSEGLS